MHRLCCRGRRGSGTGGLVHSGGHLFWQCRRLCLAVLALRKKPLAVLAGSALVWVLNLAAPVSWMVLSKAHAYVHVHLVPMLWHFALVPVSCALLVWLGKTAITAVKE